VTHLRDRVIPPAERSTATRVYVGGATASQVDFAHVLASKLPLFIAIVVGLAALLLLVYEVFLVSRIHEEWQRRRDAGVAISEGLAHTGRVITAAAAVMVAVFGAFAISGERVLAMFGLMMASAVFLDALVVRMLLVPAVLQLVGRTTWRLLRWLGRRLPRVALEAEPEPTFEPLLGTVS
jgi:RND superfamily putative drug exporter